MAIMDLEYIEIDGLFYPNIEVEGSELLKNLGKYGCLRLEYLHGFKQEMYRELLFTGKLAEHCAAVDMRAFELSERIRVDYLKQHPMPEEDALERIRISEQAQAVADEIVKTELIYVKKYIYLLISMSQTIFSRRRQGAAGTQNGDYRNLRDS